MVVDPFIFTLLLEMLAVTSVVAVGMFLLNHSRKKRDRKAAQMLVERLREGQEQRLGENRKILTSSFGLEEKQAAELATGIDCAERRFYQTLIATYLRRDYATLQNIDTEFMGTVETYRTLTPSLGDGDNSEEIKRLREEKKRLAKDLQSAMEAMGGVLNDYSSVLPGGGPDTQSDVQEEPEHSSTADDGIVVEEVKAQSQDEVQAEEADAEEAAPADEATTHEVSEEEATPADETTTQEVSEDEATPAEDPPVEETADDPDSPAAEAEEAADPSVESAAAIAAAEEIDIPDYSGLGAPDLDDKSSD